MTRSLCAASTSAEKPGAVPLAAAHPRLIQAAGRRGEAAANDASARASASRGLSPAGPSAAYQLVAVPLSLVDDGARPAARYPHGVRASSV